MDQRGKCMKFLLVLCGAFLLFGCANSEPSFKLILDENKDGKRDVFFEEDKKHLYELRDSNFDGKVDQSHAFKKQSGEQVQSSFDQNFDGYMETFMYYRDEKVFFHWVDTDLDGVGELFFFYKNDVLSHSKKYISQSGKQQIEVITYKYDYPSKKKRLDTSYSKQEFHAEMLKNVGL